MTKRSNEDSGDASSDSASDDSNNEGGKPIVPSSSASKRARTQESSSSTSLGLQPLEVAPVELITGAKSLGKTPPIIILLDQATLETVKNKLGVYELLNCDDHRELVKRKMRRDPNEYRPDILHQELLALLDSPLNKAGLLKVYIQTKTKVLIDVHPSIRIPRTYKRFAGLMVQLLHKMKIKAGTESTTLLKVIKNPFSQYLPAGTACFGMSCQGTLYRPLALAEALIPVSAALPNSGDHPPTCFVVGAMSVGHVTIQDHPYIQKMFSISEYPLSGAAALSRIMTGIEHHWGIV